MVFFEEIVYAKTGTRSNIFPFCKQKNCFNDRFNNSVCVSVDDEIAHGSPSHKKLLKGQIVSADFGLALPVAHSNRLLHFDAAFTAAYKTQEQPEWVLQAHKALQEIITNQPRTTGEISSIVAASGYSRDEIDLVVSLTGHGIGYSLHERPAIYNAPGTQYDYQDLFEGLCFCAEPVFAKSLTPLSVRKSRIAKTYLDSDGWTVKTIDGSSTTHFETMFCVTNNEVIDLCGITEWFHTNVKGKVE